MGQPTRRESARRRQSWLLNPMHIGALRCLCVCACVRFWHAKRTCWICVCLRFGSKRSVLPFTEFGRLVMVQLVHLSFNLHVPVYESASMFTARRTDACSRMCVRQEDNVAPNLRQLWRTHVVTTAFNARRSRIVRSNRAVRWTSRRCRRRRHTMGSIAKELVRMENERKSEASKRI